MNRILMILLLGLLLIPSPVSAIQPDDQPPTDQPPAVITEAAELAPFDCSYDAEVKGLIGQTNETSWMDWIRKLSGEQEVTVEVEGVAKQVRLDNRHSYVLFTERDSAYEYLRQQLLEWYPLEWIEEDSYTVSFAGANRIWKNLILTIPGTTIPKESVILSAHFDSTTFPITRSIPLSTDTAPGADDNASGSSALLEAARILQGHPLDRTVRLIWFTGEEQGLYGSQSYVNDHSLSGIIGVINLDMFAYDSNADGCFELHVSNYAYPDAAPESDRVGQCFLQTVGITEYAYAMPLKPEYSAQNGTGGSDHASFWRKGVGAIEVLENSSFHSSASCPTSDWNPFYHSVLDTTKNSIPNPTTGYTITRAALATAFRMAIQPGELWHYAYFPVIQH